MIRQLVLLLAAGALLIAPAPSQSTLDTQDTPQARSDAARHDRAITDRYLTTVKADLAAKVDTRNAQPGQQIAARLREDAELANGARLPKGTRLTGRIVQVQPQREHGAGAVLVLTFDRAEPKNGPPIPVRCVLQMVAPAAHPSSSPEDVFNQPGSGAINGDPRSPNAGLGDGARVDPTARGPLGTVDPTSPAGAGSVGSVGSVDATGRPMPGGAGSIDGPTRVPSPLGSIDPPVSGEVERPVVNVGDRVHGGARATALPGVVLVPSESEDISGMLTDAGKNITLDAGAQLTLGVIAR